MKIYTHTTSGKLSQVMRNARYRITEKNSIAQKKYYQSEKGKKYLLKKYRHAKICRMNKKESILG
jgi:hypothetical protein